MRYDLLARLHEVEYTEDSKRIEKNGLLPIGMLDIPSMIRYTTKSHHAPIHDRFCPGS